MIPANTNPVRAPGDGSSATAAATIAHPATSNKNPATFILFYALKIIFEESSRLEFISPERITPSVHYIIIPTAEATADSAQRPIEFFYCT